MMALINPRFTPVLTLLALAAFSMLAACSDEEQPPVTEEDTGRPQDTSSPVRDIGGLADLIGQDTDDPDTDESDVSESDADAGSGESDGSSDADGSTEACVSDCDRVGDTECARGGIRTCQFDIARGCLLLSEPEPCGTNRRCEDDVCVDGACEDTCFFTGRICSGTDNAVNECVDTDEDGCREVSPVQICAPGEQTCDAGRCISVNCDNACAIGQTSCAGDGAFRSCGDYDNDGCLEFGGPATPCESPDVCFAGVCGEDVPRECMLFSEIVEGTSNNKAVEVHNCGNMPLAMAGIKICMRNNDLINGCTTPVYSMTDGTATLNAGEVFVVANGSAGGTLRGLADDVVSNFPTFTGDDRIILFRDTNNNNRPDSGEILDAFGDPGRVVSGDPYQDQTYRRCSLDAHVDGNFNVSDYYTEHATDDFSDLGTAPTYSGCD